VAGVRNWPIRRQIVVVLLLPVLALVASTVYISLGRLDQARTSRQTSDAVRWLVSIHQLVHALQTERFAVTALASTGYKYPEGVQVEDPARAAGMVDVAYERVRQSASGVLAHGPGDLAAVFDEACLRMDGINVQRVAFNEKRLDPSTAMQPYTNAVSAWLNVETTLPDIGDSNLGRTISALSAISWNYEYATHQYGYVAALMGYASSAGQILPGSAPLPVAAMVAKVQTSIGAEQAWLAYFRASARPEQVAFYDQTVATPSAAADAVRDSVLAGGALPVDLPGWGALSDAKQNALRAVEARIVSDIEGESADAVRSADLQTWLTIAVIVLEIALTIGLSALLSRRLVRSLRNLRDGALRAAMHRLPQVTETLRAGQLIDPASDPPPFAAPARNEIGDVAAACNTLYQAAVAATYEMTSVKSVSDVLRTLARRSLHLTRRQIKLISELERAEENPSKVQTLFGIDHQATRMRRLAESLLVLAGDQPHQLNRQSALLFDILRAAASEVEEYTRLEISPVGMDVRVAGPAVADLTHLLAELLENATAFSPVDARVDVRAGQVGHGWAIDIEDRGVGLDEAQLDRLNQRLADPPPFEPQMGGQIGLIVVARLAARHGIAVYLRRGVYHGVHVVVVLPLSMLEGFGRHAVGVSAVTARPQPAIEAAGAPVGREGRHAHADYAAAAPPAAAPTADSPWPAGSPQAAGGGMNGMVPGRPRPADTGTGLPPLPTRVRGAEMAEQLRGGQPVWVTDNGAQPPPEHARRLAEGFINGFARGQRASSAENGEHDAS
jgi:signal transduction histidine kinase